MDKSKIVQVLKFIGIIFSSLSVVTGAIVGIVSAVQSSQIPDTSSCIETELESYYGGNSYDN